MYSMGLLIVIETNIYNILLQMTRFFSNQTTTVLVPHRQPFVSCSLAGGQAGVLDAVLF